MNSQQGLVFHLAIDCSSVFKQQKLFSVIPGDSHLSTHVTYRKFFLWNVNDVRNDAPNLVRDVSDFPQWI